MLAIGGGYYDGGFSFHGELLLANLETGGTVSALDTSVEVRTVSWRPDRDGRVLDIGVSPTSDNELGRDAFVAGFDGMVERADWTAVGPGSIGRKELDGPHRPNVGRTTERSARRALRRLARQAGRRWTYRGAVQDLRMLGDGRFLAAVDGGLLEAWDTDGNPLWSVPGPRGGGRLVPERGGDTVWALSRAFGPPASGSAWRNQLLRCVRYSVHDGTRLRQRSLQASAYLGRAAGLAALLPAGAVSPPLLMDTEEDAGGIGGALPRPVEPRASFPGAPALLPVRGARVPYALLPATDHGASSLSGSWVARVDVVAAASGSDAAVGDTAAPGPADSAGRAVLRRLFPLPVGSSALGHLGPLAEILDARGPALLVTSEPPRQDRTAWPVARFRLPDGRVLWRTDLGARPTALLHLPSRNLLCVALSDDSLAVLDARDGSLGHRQRLVVGGLPTTAHTLTEADDGRLLVGTVDGRVLVVRVG
ncbi:PQQ-binding-like beta-propeller repeat protein [Streptomyces sp. NPDC008150]|uniref:outer membrane protein assembly factor BamB family protein n=1 Tax=Streptomyces sp. NPDC008150 TaxID=3364816 RepID=UPI0036ED20DE